MRSRKLLSEAIDVVEVAIGLVFVLLVQLGIIEAFIVELGNRWGGGLGSALKGILRCGKAALRSNWEDFTSHNNQLRFSCARISVLTFVFFVINSCIDVGLLLRRGVQLLLHHHRFNNADTWRRRGVARGPQASTLNGKRLVHDGAATGDELQVGDGATTG